MSLAFDDLSLCHVTEIALVKVCSYNPRSISFRCRIEIFFVHYHNSAELSRGVAHISIIYNFLDVVGVRLCSGSSIVAAVSITYLLYEILPFNHLIASLFMNRSLIFTDWSQYLMLLRDFISKLVKECSIHLLSSPWLHFRIYSCCIGRFIVNFFIFIWVLLNSFWVCIITCLKTKLLVYIVQLLLMALSVD